MDETETAELCNVSVGFLCRRRLLGQEPKYIKIGPTVRYSLPDVQAFLAANTIAAVEVQ
jgi:hypothetical protein